MRTRLNGWQRIGIVLSVIWIFVGGFWGNNIGIHQGDWAVSMLGSCYDIRPNDWASCQREFHTNFSEAVKYHWYAAAFLAFVPTPIAWLIVYGVVAPIRWIRRGFNHST